MCLTYHPKERPAFTRLCYRYRELRGAHVTGSWQCGEYPRPGRWSNQSERSTLNENPEPTAARRSNLRCKCGNPTTNNQSSCNDCYVLEQIKDLPPEAYQFLPETARRLLELS